MPKRTFVKVSKPNSGCFSGRCYSVPRDWRTAWSDRSLSKTKKKGWPSGVLHKM